MDEEDRDALFARLREEQASADELISEAHPTPSVEPVNDPSPDVQTLAVVVEYDEVAAYLPLRLRHPLTVDGLRVEQISLNPPCFGDVEAVLRGNLSEIEMHANMAALPVAVLRALRWTDSELVTFMARRLAPDFGVR